MTCREFIKELEALKLTELSSPDTELLAHQSSCASCAALLRERNALAGAMQVLRSSTARMEASYVVEQNVLRAFRHGSAVQSEYGVQSQPQPVGFRLRGFFFGWGTYAAVAAVLAIGLGLGLWFAQHSDKPSQKSTAKAEQVSQPSVNESDHTPQVPVRASTSNADKVSSGTNTASQRVTMTSSSLAQSEQAQGYTPLMLCDPISCSGDAEVVRMELPTTAADGSNGSQMADVIVGDDGLVRAIRIVQQQ